MGWFSKLFSGGISDIVNAGGDLVDRFVQTEEEKQEFKLRLEAVVTERMKETELSMRTELKAKESLLTADRGQYLYWR